MDIEELKKKLKNYSYKVREKFANNDYLGVINIIENEILKIAPNHRVVLEDLAFAYDKINEREKSYKIYKSIIDNLKENTPSTTYDGIVATCGNMERWEEAKYFSRLCIKKKKLEALENNVKIYSIPKEAPLGLSEDKRKNIISYSLYGNLPRYCEIAVINVELAKIIYPQWTCRFYVDDTVPDEIIQRLERSGAEVIFVSEEEKEIKGLFWRFKVMDDKNVQCFMIRDADSFLSYKESAAVSEWLNSKKWFHIMRDNELHCELILAGMWGGYNGVFFNVMDGIKKYFNEQEYTNRLVDQIYLREFMWTTISQSVLAHDEFLLDRENGLPFPEYEISDIERIKLFHIGMIDATLNSTLIYIESDKEENVRWSVINENNGIICNYESKSKIKNGENIIEINLPSMYSEKIKNNEWIINYQIL